MLEKSFCDYVAHLIDKNVGEVKDLYYSVDRLNMVIELDEPEKDGGKKGQRYEITIKKQEEKK